MTVDPMLLSFDVTAIDIVLMVALLVLFALVISQKRGKVRAELQSPSQVDRVPQRLAATNETPIEEQLPKRRSAGFQKCIHNFGHLRNLPHNTAVPDECFGCPKVMRCLFPDQ